MTDTLYERIYLVVRQIPAGSVATYGDVAQIVGGGCDARTVGEALNRIPKREAEATPWQRVINAQGAISTRGLLQRQLLEAEGLTFNERGQLDLARHRWPGPLAAWCTEHGCTPLPPRPAPEGEQLSLF